MSPVVPTAEQVQSHNGQRDLHFDPDAISPAQDPLEEDPLDMQEVSIFFPFRTTQLVKIGHLSASQSPLKKQSHLFPAPLMC